MRTILTAALAATAVLLPVAVTARGHQDAGVSWRHSSERPAAPTGVDAMRHEGAGLNHYPSYRPIQRGGVVPHDFAGPRHAIRDHGRYGFAAPMTGTRWVRYYDDALLVDGAGRVRDARHGMDFDRYGDRWDRDERGIPFRDDVYVSGDRDYAWSDRFERDGEGLVYDRDYPYDYPYGGEGRESDYPPGYGYGGHTVTYTTTTTAPSVVRRTVYEPIPAARPTARRQVEPRRYKKKTAYRSKAVPR